MKSIAQILNSTLFIGVATMLFSCNSITTESELREAYQERVCECYDDAWELKANGMLWEGKFELCGLQRNYIKGFINDAEDDGEISSEQWSKLHDLLDTLECED